MYPRLRSLSSDTTVTCGTGGRVGFLTTVVSVQDGVSECREQTGGVPSS